MKKNIIMRTIEFTVILFLVIAILNYLINGGKISEAAVAAIPIGIGYLLGYRQGQKDE